MPGQIVHYEIPADDTAKGREFWSSLFGWQFEAFPGPFEYHMARISDQSGAATTNEERAVVYYTALLVNVGCHTDAHEQAKWFGDDIALKSTKYDHEFRSLRATAATMRLLGSGKPVLHRFRVGLEFVLSGHRDLDGM